MVKWRAYDEADAVALRALAGGPHQRGRAAPHAAAWRRRAGARGRPPRAQRPGALRPSPHDPAPAGTGDRVPRPRGAGAGWHGAAARAIRPRLRVRRLRSRAPPPPRLRALRARRGPRREAAAAAPPIGRFALWLPREPHRTRHLRPLRELPAREPQGGRLAATSGRPDRAGIIIGSPRAWSSSSSPARRSGAARSSTTRTA